MSARAIIGAGDLPLVVRAERVPLALTRASLELLVALTVEQLEVLEEALKRGSADGFAMPAMVAERIALIDALAELRGER